MKKKLEVNKILQKKYEYDKNREFLNLCKINMIV